MRHFLLFYETASDYLERRPMYRAAHLEKARAAKARGELILAGALAEPADFYRMPAYAPGEAVLHAISHAS